MQTFNPDTIIVKDTGTGLNIIGDEKFTAEMQAKLKDSISIHQSWGMEVPEMGGTAWIRITPQLRDFFKLCHEKHGVIGFEYDFDEGGLNFGLILRKAGDEKEGN
jgi:hypothetical protein